MRFIIVGIYHCNVEIMMNEGYLAVIIIFFNPLFYDLFNKYLNEHLLFVTALYQMYNKIFTCIWLFLPIVKKSVTDATNIRWIKIIIYITSWNSYYT